jgi:hypothetical protein
MMRLSLLLSSLLPLFSVSCSSPRTPEDELKRLKVSRENVVTACSPLSSTSVECYDDFGNAWVCTIGSGDSTCSRKRCP